MEKVAWKPMANVFDWLMKHYGKEYTGEQWADLVSIQVIDDDGWRSRGLDFDKAKINLASFLECVMESTIMP